jgi:hypothetical protein
MVVNLWIVNYNYVEMMHTEYNDQAREEKQMQQANISSKGVENVRLKTTN